MKKNIILAVLVCSLCSVAISDLHQPQKEEGIKVRADIDPFTDQELLVISKEIRVKNTDLRLVIRCSNRKPAVFLISFSSHFDDDPEITSRIGAGDVKTEVWNTINDGSVAFHPQPKSFILKIGEPERVAIRYQYSPQGLGDRLASLFSEPEIITVVFDLKGIIGHMTKLKSACGWNG